MVTTDFNSGTDYLNSIGILPNGGVIAVGNTNNQIDTRVAIARYDSTGNPDILLNGNGTMTERIIQGATFFTCTTIQLDGKILAGGYTWNGRNYDFAVARYNLNGSLDNTFSGDGMQITDFNNSDDKVWSIAVQNDGKIVVGGLAGDGSGLVRYNADGSLDISFSGDGMLAFGSSPADYITKVCIQSDGKILTGGSILSRYNIDGSPDINFGTDGHIAISQHCNDLTLQADGGIVAIGNYIVYRYKNNGNADSTFGDYGERVLSEFFVGYFDVYSKAVKVQPDGRIIVAASGYFDLKGGVQSAFELGRLNGDGSFDATFNNGEVVITYPASVAFATSALIQLDNKIILAGYQNINSVDDFIIARYNTDGSLDNAVNGTGIRVTPASTANDRIANIAISENKLYAVGYGQYPGNQGVVARYLLDPEGGPGVATFVTAADGDWNNSDTWIGGIVPYSTAEVIVRHNVTVHTYITCYSLKVEQPAGYLTVVTGANLSITH